MKTKAEETYNEQKTQVTNSAIEAKKNKTWKEFDEKRKIIKKKQKYFYKILKIIKKEKQIQLEQKMIKKENY